MAAVWNSGGARGNASSNSRPDEKVPGGESAGPGVVLGLDLMQRAVALLNSSHAAVPTAYAPNPFVHSKETEQSRYPGRPHRVL